MGKEIKRILWRVIELCRMTRTKNLGPRVRWKEKGSIQRKGNIWYQRKHRLLWGEPLVIVWCTDGQVRILDNETEN